MIEWLDHDIGVSGMFSFKVDHCPEEEIFLVEVHVRPEFKEYVDAVKFCNRLEKALEEI